MTTLSPYGATGPVTRKPPNPPLGAVGPSFGSAMLRSRYRQQWTPGVARSDEVREQTIDWIEAFDVPYSHLRMRAAGDFTPDEYLKRQWIAGYDLAMIMCVFDDWQKVVDMWRELGLTCFQVTPGDF